MDTEAGPEVQLDKAKTPGAACPLPQYPSSASLPHGEGLDQKWTQEDKAAKGGAPSRVSRGASSSASSSVKIDVRGDGDETKDVSSSMHQLPRVGGSSNVQVMEWNVAEYKVPQRKGGGKVILQNVVGKAEAGTFSAILGPSGCGKTSLLDCLALRNRRFTGTLRLDGQPLTGAFFLHTGYVHQKELFFPHMTSRELLRFHAITRLSRVLTHDECMARVGTVLREVDLTKAADTKIGGGELYVTKGLSGGERKRLNIALELLADPSVLLLDEPTSGLDSVMGELVCLLLHDLACRDPKRIVICALHSPSSRLFTLFSHVTLLTSNGELAYWGTRKQLLPFFERLGFVCPPRFNPADLCLELASTRVLQNHAFADEGAPAAAAAALPTLAPPQFVGPSSSVESVDNGRTGSSNGALANGGPPVLCHSANSAKYKGALMKLSDSSPKLVAATHAAVVDPVQQRLGADNRHQGVQGVKGGRSSLWTLFKMNVWRAWIQESREKIGMTVRLAMNVLLGLIFGFLYLGQIPHDGGRNTMGFLFSLLVTVLIASSIQVCLHFPFDFAILMREYYAGANQAGPYFMGRTLAAVPLSLVYLIMAAIPYFMAGLAYDAATFGFFCLVVFLGIFAAQSVGYLASSFSANPVVGLSFLPLIITPMILFSGLLYERRAVPPGLQWVEDISVINYGYALLVRSSCTLFEKGGGGGGGAIHTLLLMHSYFQQHNPGAEPGGEGGRAGQDFPAEFPPTPRLATHAVPRGPHVAGPGVPPRGHACADGPGAVHQQAAVNDKRSRSRRRQAQGAPRRRDAEEGGARGTRSVGMVGPFPAERRILIRLAK